MAEFCKKCFIESCLDSSEKQKLAEGKLRIIISKDTDFCESCCEITNVVERVEENEMISFNEY